MRLFASSAVTLVALLAAAFAAALAGAAEPVSAVRSVRVVADVAANGNTATALDLVFVYDTAAVAVLPNNGPAWFAQRAALRSALGAQIEVVSLQVPPATVIEQVPLPKSARRARVVLCFVNFTGPAGQAVGDLTAYRYRHAEIRLLESNVRYGPAVQ